MAHLRRPLGAQAQRFAQSGAANIFFPSSRGDCRSASAEEPMSGRGFEFRASLAMLQRVVEFCPEELWLNRASGGWLSWLSKEAGGHRWTEINRQTAEHHAVTLVLWNSLNFLGGVFGGRGRNRTYNLSVKSRMLCQLSYASKQG
jgi:hypothetical protein